MKKGIMLAGMCLGAALLTGCIGPKMNNVGFPTVPGGLLFSDMQGGQFVQPREVSQCKYVVVKQVSAEAYTTSYVGLVSVGDGSYATLKQKALSGTGADDLINLEVDFKHDNILGIVNKVQVKITGTAIKYVK